MVRIKMVVAALGLGAAMHVALEGCNQADAITVNLAKKCRALAIEAHPYKLPGQRGQGSAKAERDYFNECVARGGNMPPESTHGEPPAIPAEPQK